MNGRTARLLDKVAQKKANTQKQKRSIKNGLKRMWKDLPWNERHDKRLELQEELED